jgi:DHA1 family bicyclomycin/chloramphenicol resistance-like MFS transporter
MVASPRFMALVLASGVPFNGLFLYVLASPAWLGGILGLPPQHFFWFFFLSVAGIVGGAWWSGRMAGRTAPRRQVRIGFALMGTASAVNVAANALFEPHVAWALFPVAVFSLGWALMVPVVTLLVLDAVPERRGMASSVQAAIGSAANGLVAGALVPLVMHSALALAVASAALMGVGVVAWSWVKRRLPVPPASA